MNVRKPTRPSIEDKAALALWAAACATRVLRHFETHRPEDGRPRAAIAAARTWAKGKLPFASVRTAALAAHAAARSATDPAAVFAARSAGHAAATAHSARHAAAAGTYALKAVTAAATSAASTKERSWQSTRLAPRLRPIAFPMRP